MAHKFNADFKKSWITRRGPKLILSPFSSARETFHPGTRKCYEFVFLNWKQRSPEEVTLAPVKQHHCGWLFGPASKLSTRTIVYPCSRGKCSLPCPCLICQKKSPVCRTGAKCDCEECTLYEDDHINYHGCFHLNCQSCTRLVKTDQTVDFSIFDKNRKPRNRGIYSEEILEPSFKLPPAIDPRRPRHDMLKSYLDREKWTEKLKNFNKGVEDDAMWCYVCSTMFFHEDMLRDHMAKHGVSKIFRHNFENTELEAKPDLKCYQCSSIFDSKVNLTRHIESVHFKESIECPDCDKSFSRKDNYEAHRKTKHSIVVSSTGWKCGKCGKTFNLKRNFTRHLQEVCPDGKIYVTKCEFCESTYIRTSDLKKHVMNRAEYFCNVCQRKFCSSKILLAHKEEHGEVTEEDSGKVAIDLGKDAEIFGCEVCGKSFGKDKTLLQHKSTHSDEKNFECHDCGTKFSMLKNLRRHIKEAASSLSVCNFCDNVFCTAKLLRGHVISSHKKFSCPICKEPFTHERNLNRHVGKRITMLCPHCNKVFCNQKRLKEHVNLRHSDKLKIGGIYLHDT